MIDATAAPWREFQIAINEDSLPDRKATPVEIVLEGEGVNPTPGLAEANQTATLGPEPQLAAIFRAAAADASASVPLPDSARSPIDAGALPSNAGPESLDRPAQKQPSGSPGSG
jgi:hypothetical protein